MASGFMSSLAHRLFHSKHRDRNSPRVNQAAEIRTRQPFTQSGPSFSTSGVDNSPSTLVESAARGTTAAAAISGSRNPKRTKTKNQEHSKPIPDAVPLRRKAGREKEEDEEGRSKVRKKKSPLFSSLRRKTRPLSCIAARPDSPTDLQAPSQSSQSSTAGAKASPKQTGKSGKEREKAGRGQQQQQQQRQEKKKPRRPLSCIVQPPSPRPSLRSADTSPQQLSRFQHVQAPSSASSTTTTHRECGQGPQARPQPRPRPVSCFVQFPADRPSPPPYCRTPQSPSSVAQAPWQQWSDQFVPFIAGTPQSPSDVTQNPRQSLMDQYVPFTVGSPQRAPPSYLEASRRLPNKASSPPQNSLLGDQGGSISYHQQSPSQQAGTRATADASLTYNYPDISPLTYDNTNDASLPYDYSSDAPLSYDYTHNASKSSDYTNDAPLPCSYTNNTPSSYNYSKPPLPSSYPSSTPNPCYSDQLQDQSAARLDSRQQVLGDSDLSGGYLTPATDRPPQGSGRCGDPRCFLSPCPYRLPPPQSTPPYSYDLKGYFPSVSSSPAPRYSRPMSACFLCDSHPCRLETTPRPSRPRSQCFLPDGNMSWVGAELKQNSEYLTSQQEPEREQQAAAADFVEGEQVLVAEESASTSERPTSPTVEKDPPFSSSSLSTSPSSYCSPTPTSPQVTDRPPPRPARRTLAPRPKSTILPSAESESSPPSSPAPSPRPRRFPLKKYRSADCLDRVDEDENLEISPPPAKPLSYFTSDATEQSSGPNNKEEDTIFTSAEMLEKLGQPRPRQGRQQQRHQPRPVSCFVGTTSSSTSADESGYLSNVTLGGGSGYRAGWLGGLSVSTGDILELLEGDEVDAADDELSFERASSFRKAWSVCSLLAQDSLQDRSFNAMRRRRQRMKDRRHHHHHDDDSNNQRSSSTETDEGVEVKGSNNSTSSLLEEGKSGGGESATVAGIPLDRKMSRGGGAGGGVGGGGAGVLRLHSAHMKAWQIRLRRKQMMKRQRSSERVGPIAETLV